MSRRPYESPNESSLKAGWHQFQLGLLLLIGSLIFRSPLVFVVSIVVMLAAILYVRLVQDRIERSRQAWIDELTGRDPQ